MYKRQKLEGPAREHIGETLFLRWESFKASLLESFQMNSIAATDKLREIRKGKNQTVDAHAEEFKKLRSLAFPTNLSSYDKETWLTAHELEHVRQFIPRRLGFSPVG